MSKTYGVKEKDVAAAFIIDQILNGELHTGDRVDRNEIASTLGMSRVPVDEAIVQLERDGILSTLYYRGAFVEQFDATVVREHHEVYGVLSGIASARAATDPTPRLINELKILIESMQIQADSGEFEDLLWEFRRKVNYEYAGPRLRAAIRAFQSFIPKAFWLSYEDNQTVMLPFYLDEFAAIRSRDPEGARAACSGRSAKMAEIVVRELVERGVFDAEDASSSLFPQETSPS